MASLEAFLTLEKMKKTILTKSKTTKNDTMSLSSSEHSYNSYNSYNSYHQSKNLNTFLYFIIRK